MGKTYSPGSLVALPRTNALDVEALAISLITAASATAVPGTASKSFERLKTQTTGLSGAIASLVTPKAESTQPLPHVIDPRLDRCLSLTRQWIEAILYLDEPENTLRDLAKSIHDVFFADGLTYINLSYQRQWSAVRARLTVADELGLDAVFAELNGAFFIASIRRLHSCTATRWASRTRGSPWTSKRSCDPLPTPHATRCASTSKKWSPASSRTSLRPQKP